MKKISPIHPGEVLAEEFLAPMNISQYRLAKEISVPPQFWLNLQAHFDLAQEENRLGVRLEHEVQVLAMA